MGNFDDLIPKNRASGGTFDDLIPKKPAAYKAQDFGFGGLPGLGAGRGMNAAKRGVSWEDVPGVVAKAASGYFGNAPERAAERPIQVSESGLFGIAPGTKPEAIQSPYPRPITEEGKRLGNEIDEFSNVAGAAQLASDAPEFIKNTGNFIDYLRKIDPKQLKAVAAEKLVKLLKPKIGELNSASNRGAEDPEFITRTLPFVKPSKDFSELAMSLGQAKNKTIKARNELLRKDNFDLGGEFLVPLKRHIMDLRKRPQTEDIKAELETAIRVYKDYQDWAQGGISRIKGQAEKVRLQRETEPLLKKVSKGEAIDRNPDIVKAKDRIRLGLKEYVHAGDPEIINRDLDYGALKQTSAMAINQKNLAKKAPEPGMVEKILIRTPIIKEFGKPLFGAIGRNKPYSIQMALEALNQEPDLEKQTKSIASLYERAKTLEHGVPAGVPGGTPPRFKPQIEFSPAPAEMKFLADQRLKASDRLLESRNAPLQITGPNTKSLGVTNRAGEGFEIKPPITDDERRLLERQSFSKEIEKNPRIEIPFFGARKEPAERNAAGNIIIKSALSALEAALKRRFGKG